MKQLLIVHPSNLVKVIYNVIRPLISRKFGRKVSSLITCELDSAVLSFHLDDVKLTCHFEPFRFCT